MEITLITGNENKLKEFKAILTNFNFKTQKIDLDEIQSTDLIEICEHKAKSAYNLIQKPVMVEDTGAFLDELKGLPGPFIKFFEQELGAGALIKLLGNATNRKCEIKTCITYYDGENLISSLGIKSGTITEELAKGEGFYFDFCFIPKNHEKTYSQLGTEIKNQISHRALAIKQFEKDIGNILNKQAKLQAQLIKN